MGLVVDDLESDQEVQDLVLTIYHACSHVFAATSCVKIVENQMGRAYVKSQQVLMQMVAPGQIPAGNPTIPPAYAPAAPLPT